jgi:hypothetical protein
MKRGKEEEEVEEEVEIYGEEERCSMRSSLMQKQPSSSCFFSP